MKRIKDADKREISIEVVWSYISETTPAWNRLMRLLLRPLEEGEVSVAD